MEKGKMIRVMNIVAAIVVNSFYIAVIVCPQFFSSAVLNVLNCTIFAHRRDKLRK
jgi:hypothetical protein